MIRLMDLRRLFPLHCKPPRTHENHPRGKYLGAKVQAPAFEGCRFLIRCHFSIPPSDPPGLPLCLSVCLPPSSVATRPLLLCRAERLITLNEARSCSLVTRWWLHHRSHAALLFFFSPIISSTSKDKKAFHSKIVVLGFFVCLCFFHKNGTRHLKWHVFL